MQFTNPKKLLSCGIMTTMTTFTNRWGKLLNMPTVVTNLMKKIYVAGFILLALINCLGLVLVLNPKFFGIAVLPSYFDNPFVIVNIFTLSLAILLSFSSAIAFFIKSKYAYIVGLITGIYGLIISLISINLIGLFFFGVMAYEMYKKRNSGHD